MDSSIGRMLRQWRRDSGLTQEALAAKAKLSVEAISALERGTRRFPHPGTVDLLASALSLSEDQRQAFAAAGSRRRRLPREAESWTPTPVVPRQLPLDVDGFVGREPELAELDRLLDGSNRSSSAVAISALTGTGGIGKSALAVHWAHQIAARFPDGQLWVNLRGFDAERPVPATEALARLLRALGVKGPEVPADLDEQAAMYRSLLDGRRMLIVVDNARDSEHARPLLPGSATCLTIVASRDSLVDLVVRNGAHRIDLDALSPSDAALLLNRLIGDRAARDPAAVSAVAARCAWIPLALRIAADLASTHTDRTVAQLASDLSGLHRRLDLLEAGADPRTAIRAVFSWSYRHLDQATQAAFRRIGLHPGPDVDRFGVAALAGVDIDHAERMLDDLRRAHLTHMTEPKRYAMHDLLRAWASEQARHHDTAQQCQDARVRLFDYYRHAALAAMELYSPGERSRFPAVRHPGGAARSFDDQASAAAWLETERTNLVAVAVHAAACGSPQHTNDLSRILFRYLVVAAHDQDAERLHTLASEVSDGPARAQALIRLGDAYSNMGRHDDAMANLGRALSISRQVGDRATQGPALLNLGVACRRLGRYTEALEHYEESLTIAREVGNRVGVGSACNNLGSACILLGRYEDAIGHLQHALSVARELADRSKESFALGNLGECYEHLGRYDEALEHHLRSLAMIRELRHQAREGYALNRLGVVYSRLRRYAEALEHHQKALAMTREIGRRRDEIEVLNDMGSTLRQTGRVEDAVDCHLEVLGIADGTGDRYDRAFAHDGLGHAYGDLAKTGLAVEQWRLALDLYEELGVPEASKIRTQLAAAGRGRLGQDPREMEAS